MSQPPLADLLAFPADFTFRVVCRDKDGLAELIGRVVEQRLGRAPDAVEEQPSKKGTFRSVRVKARVENADEIRAVYAVLKELPGVQMLL